MSRIKSALALTWDFVAGWAMITAPLMALLLPFVLLGYWLGGMLGVGTLLAIAVCLMAVLLIGKPDWGELVFNTAIWEFISGWAIITAPFLLIVALIWLVIYLIAGAMIAWIAIGVGAAVIFGKAYFS